MSYTPNIIINKSDLARCEDRLFSISTSSLDDEEVLTAEELLNVLKCDAIKFKGYDLELIIMGRQDTNNQSMLIMNMLDELEIEYKTSD